MMESISYKNILNLIKLDFFRNRKSYLYLFAGLFLATMLCYLYTSLSKSAYYDSFNMFHRRELNNTFNGKMFLYLVIPFIWLITFSVNAFAEYKLDRENIYFLQKPSSQNEKFLAKLLTYFILIPLLVFITLLFGELLFIFLYNKTHFETYAKPDLPYGWLTSPNVVLLNLIHIFYFTISCFFCASLYFKKSVFIKSLLTFSIILFLSFIINILPSLYNPKGNFLITSVLLSFFKYNHNGIGLVFRNILVLIPLLLIIVSYFKFKELEA